MNGQGAPVEEFEPETISGSLSAGVLFICDHASNALPARYGGLGLSPTDLERHIAYDIGAAHLTRRLAELFGAPAVLTRFSRLLIDANRGARDPTLVMRISDGAIVQGNASIDAAEIQHRLACFWTPYRRKVAELLDAMTSNGPIPALVSLHSFTPQWKYQVRPWQVGVLWDGDPRLAAPLICALRADGLIVGDNEPYDGALPGDTLNELGTDRGLAHLLLELRQDLLGERAAAEAWADRIASPLRIVLAAPETHMIRRYESRTTQASRRAARRRIFIPTTKDEPR
jgi:predicted N-formylglutamate amidohydrolase